MLVDADLLASHLKNNLPEWFGVGYLTTKRKTTCSKDFDKL
jgi:hypothetical protein